MDSFSGWPAVLVLMMSFVAAHSVARRRTTRPAGAPSHNAGACPTGDGYLESLATQPEAPARFAALDGLRGCLALFVVLHHAAIWFVAARTGAWGESPNALFRHCGESSVALFFMMTAFLFGSKIVEARRRPMDWLKLFTGRVLRLAPMYAVSLALMLLIVGVKSGWRLHEPVDRLADQLLSWGSFTILGYPDVNGVGETYLINAGVAWSLCYEWFFYALLPLAAVLLRVRPAPPGAALLVSAAALLGLCSWEGRWLHFATFLGGVPAIVLVRKPEWRRRLGGALGEILAGGSLVLLLATQPSAHSPAALFLLTVLFTAAACGASGGGLLTSRAALHLGEIAYSLYLLHGLALHVLFDMVLGRGLTALLPASLHWGVTAFCAVAVVLVCGMTYRVIEAPAMAAVPAATRWLRRFGSAAANAASAPPNIPALSGR